MDLSETSNASREQLIADLRSVISDAEALLKASAGEASAGYAAARQKFEQTLAAAKEAAARAQGAVVERARLAARATDDYVRDHPWQAIGVGAAIGVLVGLLVSRR